MIEEGIATPNSQKQILTDLLSLIEAKRLKGFRPILMMDANGDYTCTKTQDRNKDLKSFIREANLVDHFHEKFPDPIHIYVYGSKRLDYILADPALVEAIERIRYLGTHKGACSDHVLAYVDFNTAKLLKGEINHPIDIHTREFRLKQRDKVIKSLEELIPAFKENSIKERVMRLAEDFRKHGKTKRSVDTYQKIDQQIRETVLAVAKKVSRKKFGYTRNLDMSMCGRMLILFKMVLDCKQRNADFTPVLARSAQDLNIDLAAHRNASVKAARREVYEQRKALWAAQKAYKSGRLAWLKGEPLARA